MPQGKWGRVVWGSLQFGPGSQYGVSSVSGLDDLPPIVAQDVARTDQHGEYTGPDWSGARTVQLGLGLVGQDPDDLRALALALRDATQPQRQPEPLQFLDQGFLVYAKVRKRAIPYDAEYLWRLGTAALEFYCADPALYSLDEHSVSTTAFAPSAGRSYPLAYEDVTASTNLIINPSVADTSTGSVTYDPASTGLVGRSLGTDWRYTGPTSGIVTLGGTTSITGGWSFDLSTPQPAGTQVAGSAYVYVLPGSTVSTLSLIWRNGITKIGEADMPAKPGMQRITTTFTVPAGQTLTRMAVAGAGSSTAFYVDAAQVEPGAAVTAYFDGADGGIWQGEPNASASTRPAGTGRTYGASGTTGRVTAVNAGASEAYPVLRIDGPVANPAIEQTTTGAALVLDASLQAGEYVLIDTRTRAVLLMGSTPRRSWVRGGSTWPVLEPGSNQLAYRGSSLPGMDAQQSLLTVTWRDTTL